MRPSTFSDKHEAADARKPTAHELKRGDILDGKYQVIKKLGQGGMGAVYKVIDDATEVEFAIKVVLPEYTNDPVALKELRVELAKAQTLTHQNLLNYKSFGDTGSVQYIVMELIDGENLEEYRLRKGGKISGNDAQRIAVQILNGLNYFHEKGLVHLDLKPQNIMVSRAGEVKITDYGISTSIKEQIEANAKAGEMSGGTLYFMTPEQLNNSFCDCRTDIYALGLIFYQLLKGELPFELKSKESIVAWHLDTRHSFSTTGSDMFDQVIAKAISVDPSQRFTNCGEIIELLTKPAETIRTKSDTGGVVSLMKRGHLSLEDSDWKSAIKFFDKVLNSEPEYAPAYVGLLCAELRIPSEDLLAYHESPLSDYNSFRKAVRFADAESKARLERYDQIINERIAEAKRNFIQKREHAQKHENCITVVDQSIVCLKKDGWVVDVNGKRMRHIAEYFPRIDAIKTIHSGGGECIICLQANGTVDVNWKHTAGKSYMAYLNLHTENWRDIVMFDTDGSCVVGLKADGTVVATGQNRSGECNTENWRDIVAIAANYHRTVGLKADGTVLAVGENSMGQCNTESWQNVVAIAVGGLFRTYGLRADGTVVACGGRGVHTVFGGECNTDSWRDIVAIADGGGHIVGLKSDGTVVAVGNNQTGQCNTENWRDIVAIAAGGALTVGLKSDGTVVAVGNNQTGQCNTEWLRDIEPVSEELILKWKQEEQQKRQEQYNKLYGETKNASTENDWLKLASSFREMNGYKNTAELSSECDNKVLELRYLRLCNEAKKLAKTFSTAEDWHKLATSFRGMDGYKNTVELANKCLARYSEHIKQREQEKQQEEQRKFEEHIKRGKESLQRRWASQGLCLHCGGEIGGIFTKKCKRCGQPK